LENRLDVAAFGSDGVVTVDLGAGDPRGQSPDRALAAPPGIRREAACRAELERGAAVGAKQDRPLPGPEHPHDAVKELGEQVLEA
jgi:hypothetical protein